MLTLVSHSWMTTPFCHVWGLLNTARGVIGLSGLSVLACNVGSELLSHHYWQTCIKHFVHIITFIPRQKRMRERCVFPEDQPQSSYHWCSLATQHSPNHLSIKCRVVGCASCVPVCWNSGNFLWCCLLKVFTYLVFSFLKHRGQGLLFYFSALWWHKEYFHINDLRLSKISSQRTNSVFKRCMLEESGVLSACVWR